ncbi:patatin-like phospholipase family protein [Bradyrhizobium elkanii]|uniref:patatin-like phospholipase family protein n=1 Tax=Bradyrhizobium elkanii TaxID=29448 RepID=UPI003515BC25
MTDLPSPRPYRVLSLDGGGAKGFYTLGALKEIEAVAGRPLCETFNLIYGTSTGAIIAALLGLGSRVEEIESLYRLRVVEVMGEILPRRKTAALEALAQDVFGERRFDAFKTDMGIVGTRWDDDRPIIFKTNAGQAFTGVGSFEPGFGCTIADAVVGSCSAYPFFLKKMVTTGRGDRIEVRDGGFVANNPTLYAVADAVESLGHDRENLSGRQSRRGRISRADTSGHQRTEMDQQMADGKILAETVGDQHAVDGAAKPCVVWRCAPYPYQREVHTARDGNRHA